MSNIVNDGAYTAMIERINSDNNPNFFFLTYTKQWTVSNFLIIPKHFFTPEINHQKSSTGGNCKAGGVGRL